MVLESAGPVQSALITDPAILAGYRHDASPLEGSPEGLVRPASAAEAAHWLAEASAQGVAVTPCGLRSSTTGSPLAPHGWTMSCERLQGIRDFDLARKRAIVGAGTVLRDFKDEAEAMGLMYPPDPTSEGECSLGGTVACDASGARTFRYGPTHRWVRGLEVALLDGSVHWLRAPEVDKDAAGFAGLRDLVQVFCGSEGTLGLITAVEVQLIPKPEAFSAGFAFFDGLPSALRFVGEARRQARSSGSVRPRCLELLDAACFAIMRAQGTGLVLPEAAGAVIFFEEEHQEGEGMTVLESWWALLEATDGALPEATVVATDRARQQELRSLRHCVPATLNDEGRSHHAAGGKKISTDWAVPFDQLLPFMQEVDGWLAEASIERVVRYGHVGNGHPHYNLIVRDEEEAGRAEVVVARMCEAACALGGTVTAEHGLGKVKLPYAEHRFSELQLRVMRAVKDVLDPRGLLAPGNLFPLGG